MIETDQPVTCPVCFLVEAFTEPGFLPRVISLFARRGLELEELRARRWGSEAMRVELSINRIPLEMVHLIEGNLQQVIGMVSVTVEFRAPAHMIQQ